MQIFEGDECIIIADIPLPKMCKLQPEKNASLEVIPSDEHCLINCFAAHLKSKHSIKQIGYGFSYKLWKV